MSALEGAVNLAQQWERQSGATAVAGPSFLAAASAAGVGDQDHAVRLLAAVVLHAMHEDVVADSVPMQYGRRCLCTQTISAPG